MFLHLMVFLPIAMVAGKVCETIDVRNGPQHMSQYRDCRVVEGHVRVVLMENVDSSDYLNRAFKDLYEITDYLMIFRVMGLTSLDLIFPKLTIIGGQQLFKGFSLIVYDLPDLEQIGLESLQRIDHGNVYVKYCPKLCYVNTVNWNALGVSMVNSSETSFSCEDDTCLNDCAGYCWNNFRCQNVTKTKCHPACIGCSKPNSPKHCDVCKYFNDTSTCVQKCPQSKITDNYDGRCLNYKACVSKTGVWSIYNKTCVPSCPEMHRRSETGRCIPMNITKTWCQGMKITYAANLENMINCTHINGSLELATSNTLIEVHELEYGLGKIKFISEYLKIVRSLSITSLDFFKSLRTIKGEKLWSKYYAFYVVQNQNLQELWTSDNSTLIIQQGEILFQDNPHLCSSKIYKLTNRTLMAQKNTSGMIHVYNNGRQEACTTTKMNIRINETNPQNVTFVWDELKDDQAEKLVGYTIYYRKINSTDDIWVPKRKDNCEDDGTGWSTSFTRNHTVQLTDLEIYTLYAFYIRTQFTSYLIQQTHIDIFRTASCEPSGPVSFEAVFSTDSYIFIKWKRPNIIHKDLTHYSLAINGQEDNLPLIRQRNYCHNPMCFCPKPTELRIFLQDQSCTQDLAPCINEKYKTDNSTDRIRIRKRSADLLESNVQDLKINGTEVNYTVSALRPYTLYFFFLKACENKNCSQAEMTWLRTQKKKDADSVTHVSIKIDNGQVSVLWMEPEDVNSVIVAYNIEYKRIDSKTSTIACVSVQHDGNKAWKFKISNMIPGKYMVRVGAVSLAGTGNMSGWKYFQIGETTETHWSYGVLTALAVIVLAILVFVIKRRYKKAQTESDLEQMLPRLEAINEEIFEEPEDEWMLDSETVEIIRKLQQDSQSIAFHR